MDAKGKVTEILVTPILPNGDILSPQELEDYIYTQLEGAQNILAADTKGLVIATNVAADGSAGEKYHELQEVYYADNIKAAEGVRIYTEALKEANEEQRNKERGTALLVGQIGHAELSAQFDEEIQSWDEYLQNMEPSGKNCKLQKTFTTVKSKRLVALENGRHLKPSEMQQ